MISINANTNIKPNKQIIVTQLILLKIINNGMIMENYHLLSQKEFPYLIIEIISRRKIIINLIK